MRLALIACLLLSSPLASAQEDDGFGDGGELPPTLEPATDVYLVDYYGGRIETQLDADFTGDGLVDVAAVMRDDDAETRKLVVQVGFRGDFDQGHGPVGEMAMEPYPLGAASLSVKRGVLLVEDLTGGTSAISSTYRFRYDETHNRMRLIGDDVSYYSRTNNHDALEISTNRLTGQRIRQVMKLNEDPAPDDDAAYLPQPEVRETIDKTPIWMEDAPLPEDTVGFGDD